MRKYRSNAARRGLTVAALTAVFLFAAVAARPLPAENIDLVVMVDTSESMFPYFDDLMNYLVQDLLVAKLHRGDTFHLLSFSSVPEVEISLEVNSEEAAQRAFGRILLLHALGRYTDLVSALQFLTKYTKELPETNPKQIVLITDGVNDPPPDSPNRGTPEKIRAAVLEAAQAMKKEGWTLNILKVPPEPAPGEEGLRSYLPDLAEALGVPIVPYKTSDKEHLTGRTTGFPNITFPPNLGKVPNRFIAPFKVKNWKGDPIIVRLTSIQGDGTELLEKKVTITVPPGAEAALDAPIKLPLSFPRGEQSMHVQLLFADDLRISPTAGTLSFTYTGKGGIPIPRLTFLYVLYIVLAGGLIYLLIRLFLLMRKKLSESTVAGIGAAGARSAPAAAGRGAHAPAAAAGPQPAAARAGADGRPSRGSARIPLMGTGAAAPAAGGPARPGRSALMARRVRPTVTSLRRALPRQHMQQANLPPLIEMRVSLQNHRIGFRNVHRIAPGVNRSVGGRFSSYLIFILPFPASIGEIRNVEGKYVFTPLRTELFPGIEGSVEDCLDKEIPFVSPRGKELSLHFRQWVSPLDEINALMLQARSGDG
jgi:Mg-chelatase subunit ChlD